MNGVTTRFRSSHLRMWMPCIPPPRIKMSIRKRNKKGRFEESWCGTMATTKSMQQPGSLPGRFWYWKQGFHKTWLIENQLWFIHFIPIISPHETHLINYKTSLILSTLGAGGGNSTPIRQVIGVVVRKANWMKRALWMLWQVKPTFSGGISAWRRMEWLNLHSQNWKGWDDLYFTVCAS